MIAAASGRQVNVMSDLLVKATAIISWKKMKLMVFLIYQLKSKLGDYIEVCMKMYSCLSGISNIPWEEINFLAHGHTVPCSAIDGFVAVWLINAAMLPQIDSPCYPAFRGDRINLLWAVPIKQDEYDLIRSLDDRTAEALEHINCPVERLVIFDGEGKLS